MLNMKLIEDTLVQIERNHSAWNQATWGQASGPNELLDPIWDEGSNSYVGLGTCNTAMCFAGWGLTLAGVRLRWSRIVSTGLYVAETEDHQEVSEAAMDELGIDPYQCCSQWLAEDDDSLDGEHGWDDCLWDHDEAFPGLFAQGNEMEDIYDWLARYDTDIDREELEARVMRRALLGDSTDGTEGGLL